MINPLVSIVICTYNRAALLKDTMTGVLGQHYKNVEILIVDDGSTDNTREVIAHFGDRVRYYRQDHKGLAAARNIACKQLARGEYIAFQDDDDIMLPDRITCLYETLCRYPQAVLAVGEWEIMDAAGNLTGKRITLESKLKDTGTLLIEDGYKAILWPLISPSPCSSLVRKADGDRIGWMDERFSRSSDTDFFARFAQMGPIAYVPRVLAYVRRGHVQMWENNILNNLLCEYNNILLFGKHLASLDNDQKEIKKRLQNRMLNTLKRIVYLSSQCEEKPDIIERDYITKGLSMLGNKEQLVYKWYAAVMLPLRNAIKSKLYQTARPKTNS